MDGNAEGHGDVVAESDGQEDASGGDDEDGDTVLVMMVMIMMMIVMLLLLLIMMILEERGFRRKRVFTSMVFLMRDGGVERLASDYGTSPGLTSPLPVLQLVGTWRRCFWQLRPKVPSLSITCREIQSAIRDLTRRILKTLFNRAKNEALASCMT